MAETAGDRRLAAIAVFDVCDSTDMLARDEAGAKAKFFAAQDIFRQTVERAGGRVFHRAGDGAMAVFSSAVTATESALAALERIAADLPDLRVRAAVHLGDVTALPDGDIIGLGVNVAAHMEKLAIPGSVCVSGAVRTEILGKLDVVVERAQRKRIASTEEFVDLYLVRRNRGDKPIPRERVAPVLAKRRPRSFALLGIAGAVAAAAALAFLIRAERGPAEAKTLAVLPFANLSADQNQRYFADGMADELLTQLSKIDGLRVTSGTSSFAVSKSTLGARAIAQRLNVRYIVEGSVRTIEDAISISAKLVDTQTDVVLWSDSVSPGIGDAMDAQIEIADKIADALLLKADPQQSKARSTINDQSYVLYLKARGALSSRTNEGFNLALAYLKEAAELDPGFARAQGLLAIAYAMLAQREFDDPRVAEWLRDADDHAKSALALDPKQPDAMTAQAAAPSLACDWAKQISLLERAVKENPSDSEMARLWLGIRYLAVGRIEDSVGTLRAAHEIDPVSPIVGAWLANAYVAARELDAARDLVGGAAEANSALYVYPQYNLLRELDRKDEIDALYNRLAAIPDRDAQYMAALLRAVAAEGAGGPAANAELEMFAAAEKKDADAFFRAADAYFADTDNVRRAIVLAYLWAPRLSALRADARFSGLVHAACLDSYWSASRAPDLCRRNGEGGFTCT